MSATVWHYLACLSLALVGEVCSTARAQSLAAPIAAGDMAAGSGPEIRDRIVADLLRRAAEFRAAEEADPHGTAAKENRRLEALTLLQAGLAGDDSQKVRCEMLAAEILADPTAEPARRCEIAAYVKKIEVRRMPDLAGDQLLAQYERVARELMAEFPSVADGYEALLSVASVRSEALAAAAASELLDNPGTPLWMQQRARIVLNRQILVGKPVRPYVAMVPAAADEVKALRGRPFLIYAWATWHPGSVAVARKLAAELPARVGLLGVNLDTDVSAAKAAAKAEKLDARQLYDPDGPNSRIALALTLTTPGMVFLVDADGKVASVSVHRDLAGSLAQLAQP